MNEGIEENADSLLTVRDLIERDPYERFADLAPDTDKADWILDGAFESLDMIISEFCDRMIGTEASESYVREILERCSPEAIVSMDDSSAQPIATDGGMPPGERDFIHGKPEGEDEETAMTDGGENINNPSEREIGQAIHILNRLASPSELAGGCCPKCGLNILTHVELNNPNAEMQHCPQCGEKVEIDD